MVFLSQWREVTAEEEEEEGEVAGVRSATLFGVLSFSCQPAGVSSHLQNRRVVAAPLSSLFAALSPSAAASPALPVQMDPHAFISSQSTLSLPLSLSG